jgi:uncharacterized membrane protein YgaE (UPF0421/DUF939 family)
MVTKKQVYDAFKILNSIKLNSFNKEQKILLINFLRELRNTSNAYEEDIKFTESKLKPENFDEDYQKAIQYEKAIKDKTELPITEEEYEDFKKKYIQFQSEFIAAMKEEDSKEIEIKSDGITTDMLSDIMTENNLTVDQYFTIENIISL